MFSKCSSCASTYLIGLGVCLFVDAVNVVVGQLIFLYIYLLFFYII
jgi:hypothetical protein